MKPVDLIASLIDQLRERQVEAEDRRMRLWIVDPTPAHGWCAPSEVSYSSGGPVGPFMIRNAAGEVVVSFP